MEGPLDSQDPPMSTRYADNVCKTLCGGGRRALPPDVRSDAPLPLTPSLPRARTLTLDLNSFSDALPFPFPKPDGGPEDASGDVCDGPFLWSQA